MRQAGRYQSSYRKIRQKIGFFDLCKTPELAAQITVNAVQELGVDAAIIFSDIMVALESMGINVALSEKGPEIHHGPLDRPAIDALRVPDPSEAISFQLEAIRLARRELEGVVPLIGFAGAPLTLASYLLEGGHSSSHAQFRAFLFGAPQLAHALLEKISHCVASQLRAQIAAGCQAVQLFDSWAGILGPDDYRTFGLPYTQYIFQQLADLKVPRILFATISATLLEAMAESGAEVIGLDWRVRLADARLALGRRVAIQGNLDPACLFLEPASLERRLQALLAQAGAGPGYIFNLGHGILPQTPEPNVRFLVETVHRLSRAKREAHA
jgi:uroporphyrinogen decarboxylase